MFINKHEQVTAIAFEADAAFTTRFPKRRSAAPWYGTCGCFPPPSPPSRWITEPRTADVY